MTDWWPAFWDAVSVADLVVVVLGIAAVILFFRKLWPAIRRGITLTETLATLPEYMKKTDKAIAEIHHETHHNNGSSLKDSLARVETTLGDLQTTVDEHGDMLAAALISDEQAASLLDTLTARVDDVEDTFTKET